MMFEREGDIIDFSNFEMDIRFFISVPFDDNLKAKIKSILDATPYVVWVRRQHCQDAENKTLWFRFVGRVEGCPLSNSFVTYSVERNLSEAFDGVSNHWFTGVKWS